MDVRSGVVKYKCIGEMDILFVSIGNAFLSFSFIILHHWALRLFVGQKNFFSLKGWFLLELADG